MLGTDKRETDAAIAARKAILLFFKDYESDKFFKYDRYLKRIVRPLYNRLHGRAKTTGFMVSFQMLRRALEDAGWTVRVNDHAAARRHPGYPVGLLGYPQLLEGWSLPNPALLGPSLFDHPSAAPDLFANPRFRKYLTLGPWMQDMFAEAYGEDRCRAWFAGIDTEAWPDMSAQPKSVDLLVYDKIRWNRDTLVPALLDPILEQIRARGLTAEVIRYKFYDHASYTAALARSRAMVFVCENETQGLAYQEAMSANLPVLAWDNGFWLDPQWRKFSETMIPASSVPFFAPECGERFQGIGEFGAALDRFVPMIPHYTPRAYVQRELSFAASAQRYAEAYLSCG